MDQIINLTPPLVTVIIPVKNSEKYIEESVNSIINQSYTNLEILILENGSTDNTLQVLSKMDDKRLKIVNNQHLTFVESLNSGILLAKGKYIARMDSDDIALSNRISEQVSFMELNTDIDASGAWYSTFNNNGWIEDIVHPTEPSEIKASMLYKNSICNPCSIVRTEFLIKNSIFYSEAYLHCEDYHFWALVSLLGKLSNLPQQLLRYRIHAHQISTHYRDLQWQYSESVRAFLLSNLKVDYTKNQLSNYEKILRYGLQKDIDYSEVYRLLNQIIEANKRLNIYNEKDLIEQYNKLWIDCLKRHKEPNFELFISAIRSDFFKSKPWPIGLRLKLMFKMLFRIRKK